MLLELELEDRLDRLVMLVELELLELLELLTDVWLVLELEDDDDTDV